MIIRPEVDLDVESIDRITKAAFTGKSYSDQTEHLVIRRLRKAGALSLSLVAEQDGSLIGHIAFSRVTIDGEKTDWFGIGPVSVMPAMQMQGVGSRLVTEGLSAIRAIGACGCVLEGSPEFYGRFGFKNELGLIYDGTDDQKYFLALAFGDSLPKGKVEFHQAFSTGGTSDHD
jgi:putative acetyltransferase